MLGGGSINNALSVKAFVAGLYKDLTTLFLVQGGDLALKEFKRNLTVELDTAEGVYRVYAPTTIVSQFRAMQGTIAIGYTFT